MKLINKILYLEFSDLLDAGVPLGTIKSALARKANSWPFIYDPHDKRRVLFEFEKLAGRYKALVVKKFGDPKRRVMLEPIRQMVVTDLKAQEFFAAHRYYKNEFNPLAELDIEVQSEYTRAASWLQMIIRAYDNKKAIKQQFGGLTEFFENVEELIGTDSIKLPATYKRLQEKLKEFKSDGYSCLISGNYGNKAAVKVSDETALAFLIELMADGRQFDDFYLVRTYNAWAQKNGLKSIDRRTICNYRDRYKDLIIRQTHGKEAQRLTLPNVRRTRPSHPLYLVEHDDNTLDFYFTDWEDKTSHRHFHRFKGIFIIDSFNDYVLGYAVSNEITVDLIKKAYQNAAHHLYELTGQRLMPHEIKCDNWSLSPKSKSIVKEKTELQKWYESIAIFKKSAVGSKGRGYLEQVFGSSHWQNCARLSGNNYTGQNITAKTEGVNRENLLELQNMKAFPTVEEAPQFFADFVERLRRMPDSKGINRQDQWLEAYRATAETDLRIVDEAFQLSIFGTLRQQTNQITSNGLDLTINGVKIAYNIPDEYYYSYKGCTVQTQYDPYDLSRILVIGDRFRFVARETRLVPSAQRDFKEGDNALLFGQLHNRKMHVAYVSDKQEERRQVLDRGHVDLAALLTTGILMKSDRQPAELAYQHTQIENTPQARERSISPLDKM